LFANQTTIKTLSVLVDAADEKVDKQAILPALAEARATDVATIRRICGLQVAEMEGWKVADAYLDITAGNCDDEALKKAKDMVAKQKAKTRVSNERTRVN